MKKILIAAAATAALSSALAQDGTFSASNIIGGVRQYIYDTDGTTTLAKANGAVQFLAGTTDLGTYGFLTAGLFSAGTISVPGQAGNTVAITIEVWDKTTGATYAAASSTPGGHYLPAQTVSITLGGAGTPPATPAALTGFVGGKLIPVVPEPSTIALAALGLGGLAFISRRK
jgi:PEP-CTERM motif